jgi:DNA polymerase III alpha subunit
MIVKNYKELKEYFEMFKKQNADLLIVMSKAGYGKTSILKEVMGKSDYVYCNTHSTPLKTYLDLFEKKDMPVVFDDLDAVFSSSIMTALLKALADTSPIKELHYNSTSKLLGNAPESFKTSSNVCLLVNEFNVNNPSLKPLIDRGFFIEFTPSREEILNRIRYIAKSQNIGESEKCVLEFIEKNYQKIENLSLRTYIKALQLFRDSPRFWKDKFMQMVGYDEKVIEYLKLKEVHKNVEDMVKHFRWSRATFFRVRSEVEDR